MSDGNVRFVRIRGRVVPIRSDRGGAPRAQKVKIGIAERDVGAGERFSSGFKIGGKAGLMVGGVVGVGYTATRKAL